MRANIPCSPGNTKTSSYEEIAVMYSTSSYELINIHYSLALRLNLFQSEKPIATSNKAGFVSRQMYLSDFQFVLKR
jgi:hypothetical protein